MKQGSLKRAAWALLMAYVFLSLFGLVGIAIMVPHPEIWSDWGLLAALFPLAVAQGGNFIDTADSYAAGRSETIIGNWMRSRRNRDQLVVATKVGKSGDHPGLKARVLTRAVHASLERLQVDHVDLLYLHIDDTSVEFEETLLAVDELIRAGSVRYFGGSDHTGNRLIEARIASAQLGVAQMVAVTSTKATLRELRSLKVSV